MEKENLSNPTPAASNEAVTYVPPRFPIKMAKSSVDFAKAQELGERNGFQIDAIVAERTGIAEVERAVLNDKIEQGVNLKLKDLEKQVTQRGYEAGLKQGREEAVAATNAEVKEKLQAFEKLIDELANLKSILVSSNESFLVKMVCQIGKKIALSEIAEKPELIIEVLRQTTADIQKDEEISIRINPNDMDFVEQAAATLGTESALAQAKIVAAPEISRGGCKVITQYGAIDATVETRVERMWQSLVDKVPAVKSEVASDESNG